MAGRQEIVVPTAGALVKHGAESMEMSLSADVQSNALAAQAEAEVKSRWAIAQRAPRDFDVVRQKLLKECDRPQFAEVAKYSKPIGGDKVSGPSIRFVETALRCMGNVLCATSVISEDQMTRRLQVSVTDLEQNVSWPRQISLRKTVERKDPKGRQVVSERVNSYGQITYEVIATEDELLNKEGSAVSKAIRTAGLRVIPGDLVDEALAACVATTMRQDKSDPQAAKKKLIDGFSGVGVTADQLKEYVGHELGTCSPVELQELRELFFAIRDGESKWTDVYELRRAGANPKTGEVTAPPPPPPAAVKPPAPAAPITEQKGSHEVPLPPAANTVPIDADEKARLEVQRLAEEQMAREAKPPEAKPSPPGPAALTWAELKPLIQACTAKNQLPPFAGKVKALEEPHRSEAMAFYTDMGKRLA